MDGSSFPVLFGLSNAEDETWIFGGGDYLPMPDPPQVVVTYPNGGETLSDSATITWMATDPDPGETELLLVDLDYSNNDGAYFWDISALGDGSNYLLRATVTDTTGLSDCDTSDSVFTIDNPEPPAAISDLTATLADSTIHLSWSEITEDTGGNPLVVDHYTVYRNADPDFSPGLADSIGSTVDTFYVDLNAAVKDTSVQHYYVVKAVDSGGKKSAESNRVGEFDRNLITSP